MKEVLTKRFWRDVKKTFDDARQGTLPKDSDSSPPAGKKPDPFAPAETPPQEPPGGAPQE